MGIKTFLKKQTFLLNIYRSIRLCYWKKMSDKEIISKRFYKTLGREVDLENPINFNDKLQWLKLNWYDPLATKCADKYEVREFVKQQIGEKYLNKLYSVYDSVDEIVFEKLPNSFVLKATHSSGDNIICKDKNSMDWNKAKKEMKRWLKSNIYWKTREWVYKDIKPRIICEQYIEQEGAQELRDYRFFCFSGEPKFISVDLNINDKKKTRRNLYDLEWNQLDAEISYPKETNIEIKKPETLETMINLARKLSASFPHARIDFYSINNKVIFGEITFFHQNGMGKFNPPEFEEEVGSYLKLPIKNAV